MMGATARFGLLGLGTMGRNLARNLADKGWSVAVWNRTVPGLEERVAERFAEDHPEASFLPLKTLEEFVLAVERPRKLLAMVPAGAPLDELLEALRPHLDAGDVVIDGGNSHFRDTERRQVALREHGIELVGMGVSGGAEGALHGPSLMPGGSPEAYARVARILESIAAKSEAGPCVTYLGRGACGHFVKMVHNGIEYGLMQLLAEAFDVMQHALGMDADQMALTFERWNKGPLQSFLLEITGKILRVRDPEGEGPLLHRVLDRAGQKGTGRWTIVSALELGVAVPTLTAGVDARILSDDRKERLLLGRVIGERLARHDGDHEEALTALHQGLLIGFASAYVQGFQMLHRASAAYDWKLELASIARIWRAGCIIRSRLVEQLQAVFEERPHLTSAWLHPTLANLVGHSEAGLRRLVVIAANCAIPIPAFSASLQTLDAIRRASLPQNLTQAQRDAFGAHTYRRIDREELEVHHTDWLGSQA